MTRIESSCVAGFHRYEIGPYRLTVLPVGQLALDGGAMFGVVPKTIWQNLTPCDHCNRIPLAMNCLLIEYQDEKWLLDTGIGTKFSPKYQDLYGITGEVEITLALAKLGIAPEEIGTVLFTHLHFDHAGGATRYDKDGQLVTTFPKARYLVHQGEWADAIQPGPKSKASYLPENFVPFQESGQLELYDGPENEVLPGLWMRVSGGHTASHQALVLDRPEGGFIYWGDLIPTSHHLKIPYVMAYDLYPVETMAVKTRWLTESFEKGWLNFFEHDQHVPTCTLAPHQGTTNFVADTSRVLTTSAH